MSRKANWSIAIAAAILPGSVGGTAVQEAAAPSIRDLSWLVGKWRFSDESTPAANFKSLETGFRTCSVVLDGSYIHCESRANSGGKARTYSFYFAFDPIESRFEMVALHGNWPRTLLFDVSVSDAGRRLDLLSEPYLDDGRMKRTWGIVKFDGQDAYIWETGNFFDGSPKGPAKFRDTVVRID